jgi:hypothetical protein
VARLHGRAGRLTAQNGGFPSGPAQYGAMVIRPPEEELGADFGAYDALTELGCALTGYAKVVLSNEWMHGDSVAWAIEHRGIVGRGRCCRPAPPWSIKYGGSLRGQRTAVQSDGTALSCPRHRQLLRRALERDGARAADARRGL